MSEHQRNPSKTLNKTEKLNTEDHKRKKQLVVKKLIEVYDISPADLNFSKYVSFHLREGF